jgi:hypothetical protein
MPTATPHRWIHPDSNITQRPAWPPPGLAVASSSSRTFPTNRGEELKIVKRGLTVASIAVAIIASTFVAASPAFASSGMSCSTQFSNNGYWFYCSGSQNLYHPWVQITCVPTWGGANQTLGWEYPGTMYAPWSFSQYLGCGNSWFRLADMPVWGPQ